MIYTGGTIGMLHQNKEDSSSPLVPAQWDEIKQHFSAMEELPFDVVMNAMELIDSSEMSPQYWVNIAKQIRDEYNSTVSTSRKLLLYNKLQP